jgi:bifunctional non-homologous end joining protein LigD
MLPRTLNPMLAQTAKVPFDSEHHLFEIKWDGIRCLAFIEAGRVRLQSRQLTEMTSQFPELACLERLPSGTVLDGELVVLQEGRPSLHEIQRRTFLQNRRRIQFLSQRTPATYMVFDVLYLKSEPLLTAPLSLRHQALQKLFERLHLQNVVLPETICQHGCQLFRHVVRFGLEGIMAKRLDGPYLPGKRSRCWLKIKPKLSPQVLMATTAMANTL